MSKDSTERTNLSFHMTRRSLTSNAIEDLQVVAGMKLEDCKSIATAISRLDSIDRFEQVPEAVKQSFADGTPEQVDAILRLVINLSSEDVPTVLETLRANPVASESRTELLSESSISALETNLKELVVDYPVIQLHEKARRVARATGNEYLGVKFYCDLRPVFDERRNGVLAIALLGNMSLHYLTQENDNKVFEMTFTEDELLELKEEIDLTLHKMEMLRPVGSHILSEASQEKTNE